MKSILEIGSQVVYAPGYEKLLKEFIDLFEIDVPFCEKEIETLIKGAPARDLYTRLGFVHSALDTDGKYGSLDFDLNFDEVPEEERGKYDLITNHGTTEHLINQLNAFRVIHDFTRAGGYMAYELPFFGFTNMVYYCYHPEFFESLARANDYDLIGIWLNLDHKLNHYIPFDPHLIGHIKELGNAQIMVFLQKTADAEFSLPFQGHYEHTRTSKIVSRYRVVPGGDEGEKRLEDYSGPRLFKDLIRRLGNTARIPFRKVSTVLGSLTGSRSE